MKKIFMLPAILLVCSSLVLAQSKDTIIKKIYLQAAAGVANKNGVFSEFSLQSVFKKNWVASVSYHNIEQDANNVPADYDPGYSTLLFFPISESKPQVNMKIVSLTFGKFLPVSRRIWFTTEAGISVVTGEKAKFTKAPVSGQSEYDVFLILFGVSNVPPNYTIAREKETTIGGMIKADFNWAFSPFAGLGAGVFANLNSIQSPVGFQVKLMFGWMNNKKKKQQNTSMM